MHGLLNGLLGLAIGVVGTLVGAGGGWAMVPLFLLGFGMEPAHAVATSLAVVCLNALSGTAAYLAQRRVQLTMAALFSLATLPGALLGSSLVQHLDRRTFSVCFGAFLLVLAGLLWRGRGADHRAEAGPVVPTPRQLGLGALVSAGVGVLSSLLGVGGGIIHVPFLVVALGMPIHAATATSHFVLAATSLAGAAAFAARGQVEWAVAVPAGLGAVVGAQVGARLSTVVPGRVLQRVLAVLLAVFAATLIAGVR